MQSLKRSLTCKIGSHLGHNVVDHHDQDAKNKTETPKVLNYSSYTLGVLILILGHPRTLSWLFETFFFFENFFYCL